MDYWAKLLIVPISHLLNAPKCIIDLFSRKQGVSAAFCPFESLLPSGIFGVISALQLARI